MAYTRTIALDLPVSDAVDRIKGALKEHAFGTLTEIDLQATMKEKLDVDIEPYMILGACNPELASPRTGRRPQDRSPPTVHRRSARRRRSHHRRRPRPVRDFTTRRRA